MADDVTGEAAPAVARTLNAEDIAEATLAIVAELTAVDACLGEWLPEDQTRYVRLLLEDGIDELARADDAHYDYMADCVMHLPTSVRSFTDFFAGIHHAVRCGEIMNGPEYTLPPNYHYMPLGYNGRASTVQVSGQTVRRPLGLCKRLDQDATPVFGASHHSSSVPTSVKWAVSRTSSSMWRERLP